MKYKYKNAFLSAILVLFFSGSAFCQNNQKFAIVLDAGHGGKDPGNSYHGFVEKDISLKTALKVGEILEKEKDIKVIYTRTTDSFIELVNRPKIANKANANLFVSIHCNSVKNFGPSGTETFVMGLSRSDMNLEVAKNENSVILLEKNYNQTYQGFNPNKPESLIGLTIMQEENLNSSISLASKIQNNFTQILKRNSRGVKQQPLWVLDAAYMPSVLIELGFLSNKEEGEFLNSEEGQYKMAQQIADAIIAYKIEYLGVANAAFKKNENKEIVSEKKEATAKLVPNTKEAIYKVQLFASKKKIEPDSTQFKGLSTISRTFNNTIYIYAYGETANIDEAKKMQVDARKIGFSDAYIVVVKDGKSSKYNLN